MKLKQSAAFHLSTMNYMFEHEFLVYLFVLKRNYKLLGNQFYYLNKINRCDKDVK